MFKKILIPTDGSELSVVAIEKAIFFAAEIDAQIIGVTVTEPYHLVSTDNVMVSDSIEVYDTDMQQLAQKRLQQIKIKCDELAIDCKLIHKEAYHPYEEIISTAEENECDIIFMASHGRRGIGALLIGSEVNKVLTHTKIPVLVFR
jgi:nucleotide-binding universal stress UspA family protein